MSLEVRPGILIIFAVLHELREIEFASSTFSVTLASLMEILASAKEFLILSVFLKKRSAIDFIENRTSFSADSIYRNDAPFASTILDACGELPERDEAGVKTVIDACLIAPKDFSAVLFKKLSEFLMKA
jgi:hypothetical protein